MEALDFFGIPASSLNGGASSSLGPRGFRISSRKVTDFFGSTFTGHCFRTARTLDQEQERRRLDPAPQPRYFGPMLKIALFALLLAPDPLFEKMAGIWSGEGERVQSVSGRHFRIQTHTVTSAQGEKLLSHNEITETDSDAQIKAYVRDYWIRPNPGQSGDYDLGVEDQVTSQRHYDGDVLAVEQSFGGSPPFVIHSRTQFDDLGSLYEESVLYGDHSISQTRIRYHR